MEALMGEGCGGRAEAVHTQPARHPWAPLAEISFLLDADCTSGYSVDVHFPGEAASGPGSGGAAPATQFSTRSHCVSSPALTAAGPQSSEFWMLLCGSNRHRLPFRGRRGRFPQAPELYTGACGCGHEKMFHAAAS
ncbi:hypothetical protein H8959_001906 [Pygathrix nigripes]